MSTSVIPPDRCHLPAEPAETDRLRSKLALTETHYKDALRLLGEVPQWQPIETAPVPPREVLKHDSWRCMLQSHAGYVCSGYAAYVQNRGRLVKTYSIQWYDDHNRVTKAAYWMPLPAAKEGP